MTTDHTFLLTRFGLIELLVLLATGEKSAALTVTATSGTIYYTIDGSDPDPSDDGEGVDEEDDTETLLPDAVADLGLDACQSHQAVHAVLAAALAEIAQIIVDLAITVYAAALQP